MKKLFTLFALFAVFSLAGQPEPEFKRHGLSMLVGANRLDRFNSGYYYEIDFSPRTGLQAGLEYGYSFTEHWALKASVRYNKFTYQRRVNYLYWPSEYSTGVYVYDPTLPHSSTNLDTEQAWQYSLGVQRISRPGLWRWYVGAETGFMHYSQTEGAFKRPLRLNTGIQAGLARYFANGTTSLFLQPSLRFAFFSFKPGFSPTYRALISALEVGIGRHF